MKKRKLLLRLIFVSICFGGIFCQPLFCGLIQVEEGVVKTRIPFGGSYKEDKEKPLVLNISLEKKEFSSNEEINIKVIFKNISPGIKRIALYDQPASNWLSFSYYKVILEDSKGKKRIFDLKETFTGSELPLVGKLIEPNQEASFYIPLTEKIRQLYPDFNLAPGAYSILVEYAPRINYRHIGYWSGRLFSNAINITITK